MNDQSLSISNPTPFFTDIYQKIALTVAALTVVYIGLLIVGSDPLTSIASFWLITLSFTFASLLYTWRAYRNKSAGIKNDGVWFSSLIARGAIGWMVGIVFTTFYVLLYWYPSTLGLGMGADGSNTGLVAVFDPMSYWIKGKPASEWFMYGFFYSLAILVLGVKFFVKYRHNTYHKWRTVSVVFFQLAFAFTIPEILMGLNLPYNNFFNMWPLNYYFFFDWNINQMIEGGTLGIFMLVWGIALVLIISPVLAYFYGKRWYCSWVCGCGGLAETAGDPFRHLSDKSLKAWRIERWMVHLVLVFAVVMTAMVLYSYFSGNSKVLFLDSYDVRAWYGFLIGASFSGVIGVGFYPLMGNRVWCRFGCPAAAILGIQQRFFSRFRITTNKSQCISCGNCSTYCEMGIDVKWYAQRGQDIIRASCVGCGICAAVCPRGVLRLENGPGISQRATEQRVITVDGYQDN
nr:4Fe-4S binding protein [Saprospiraceae bacterium]